MQGLFDLLVTRALFSSVVNIVLQWLKLFQRNKFTCEMKLRHIVKNVNRVQFCVRLAKAASHKIMQIWPQTPAQVKFNIYIHSFAFSLCLV